jgi:hypothetical protein
MARRFRPQSTPTENLRIVVQSLPWKLLLFLPIVMIVAVPAYLYAMHVGNGAFPALTHYFDKIAAPSLSPTPTPLPPLSTVLPQAGSILYTVREGDSCDSILTFQMNMNDSGQVFSDVKPETIRALNAAVGQNCRVIHPGAVIPLSPHYPLIAFGGIVRKIEASTPQQVLPTPLIRVPDQPQSSVDCSGGCRFTLQLAPQVNIHLLVQTTLSVRVGSWIWAQAMLARKVIRGFDNYPYADPQASLNGMSLKACDLQIDNTHDNNSLSCDELVPNTIDDDNGSWLLGVTGPGALDHWHYPLHLAPGTRVLIWLTQVNGGNLVFKRGNPVYRYDETTHLYVKV